MHHTYESPIGPLGLRADRDGRLTGLFLPDRHPAAEGRSDRGAFVEAVAQLDAYFAGERRSFDLALAPAGTPWQQRVWARLREIPYATTTSYGALAAELCTPRAARAVGRANALNPISIVVPCHRVVGATGLLTGYAGGLVRKQTLLTLERDAIGATV